MKPSHGNEITALYNYGMPLTVVQIQVITHRQQT